MDETLLKQIKLFLFDMDGTLYLGDRLFDFSAQLLEKIKQKGCRYMFMTNNSSKSVSAYIEKLFKMGIKANYEDFVTSAQATAYYLKKNHPNKVLYVCGTRSLKQELQENGFVVTEDTQKAQCIIMGFDTELTFRKLHDVSYMLSTREIPYIATNPDYVCPTEFGSVPDCGSVCDMIFNATGKRPIVVGKPEPLMPQLAMELTGCSPSETVVVGDRIYTDIKCGLNAGTVTILVLSGETTREILEASTEKPHHVLNDCSELLSAL